MLFAWFDYGSGCLGTGFGRWSQYKKVRQRNSVKTYPNSLGPTGTFFSSDLSLETFSALSNHVEVFSDRRL